MDATEMVPYRLSDDLRGRWLLVACVVTAILAWGWFDVRRRGRIDPLRTDAHKTDFTVYTEAGSAFFDGRDPYKVTNVRGWSYLYPPLFALTVAPLARLDTQTQTFVWFCISIAFALGCYIETRRWLKLLLGDRSARVNVDPLAILIPALLAIALPTFNCLQRGQIAILQLYFLMVGFRWIISTRHPATRLFGGILLAIPVVLKITPAMPVGCALLMLAVQSLRQRTGWLRVSLATSGVAVGIALTLWLIPAAIVGWEANSRHLQAFSNKVLQRASNVRSDDFGGEVDSPRNQSLENAVYRLGLWLAYQPDRDVDGRVVTHVGRPRVGELPRLPLANRVSFVINCALVALLVLQVMALGWDGRQQSLFLGFGLASALTLIVSPVARGHYFVMLLPMVLTAPVCFMADGRTRLAKFAAWTPVVVTIVHYTFVNSLGRVGLYGLAIAAWYLAVCCLLAAPAWAQIFRSVRLPGILTRTDLAATQG